MGLEVPHVHIHLIPMDKISDMDFTSKITVTPEELTETAWKIKGYL